MIPLLIGYALALALFLGLPWSARANPALRTDERRTRRTSAILGVAHLIALTLPLAACLGDPGPRFPRFVPWAALPWMAAALLLQRWSQRALGDSFTLKLQASEHQAISREGPYRWVRHPAYSAQIAFWTGLAAASGSIAATLAVALLSLGAYAYRLREEERVLVDALGDRYRAYARETRRLLPFVW